MHLKSGLAAIMLSSLAAIPAQAERLALGNFEPFGQGAYHAYAGMWSLDLDNTLGLGRKAVEGRDYVSSITLDKATFPRRSTIDWRVPSKVSEVAGVYGYLQLAFGDYSGSRVPTPVKPAQVRDIERLDVALTYSYSGDHRFNFLNELYLLADPADKSSALFEVGVFARASDEMLDYFHGGEQVGTYLDEEGRVWNVAIRGSEPKARFIMLIPADGNDIEGEFDWGGIFGFLREQKLLDGNEWFTGIAVGVEPVAGAGSLRLDTFEVDYRIRG